MALRSSHRPQWLSYFLLIITFVREQSSSKWPQIVKAIEKFENQKRTQNSFPDNSQPKIDFDIVIHFKAEHSTRDDQIVMIDEIILCKEFHCYCRLSTILPVDLWRVSRFKSQSRDNCCTRENAMRCIVPRFMTLSFYLHMQLFM